MRASIVNESYAEEDPLAFAENVVERIARPVWRWESCDSLGAAAAQVWLRTQRIKHRMQTITTDDVLAGITFPKTGGQEPCDPKVKGSASGTNVIMPLMALDIPNKEMNAKISQKRGIDISQLTHLHSADDSKQPWAHVLKHNLTNSKLSGGAGQQEKNQESGERDIEQQPAYWECIHTVGSGRPSSQETVTYDNPFDPRLKFHGLLQRRHPCTYSEAAGASHHHDNTNTNANAGENYMNIPGNGGENFLLSMAPISSALLEHHLQRYQQSIGGLWTETELSMSPAVQRDYLLPSPPPKDMIDRLMLSHFYAPCTNEERRSVIEPLLSADVRDLWDSQTYPDNKINPTRFQSNMTGEAMMPGFCSEIHGPIARPQPVPWKDLCSNEIPPEDTDSSEKILAQLISKCITKHEYLATREMIAAPVSTQSDCTSSWERQLETSGEISDGNSSTSLDPQETPSPDDLSPSGVLSPTTEGSISTPNGSLSTVSDWTRLSSPVDLPSSRGHVSGVASQDVRGSNWMMCHRAASAPVLECSPKAQQEYYPASESNTPPNSTKNNWDGNLPLLEKNKSNCQPTFWSDDNNAPLMLIKGAQQKTTVRRRLWEDNEICNSTDAALDYVVSIAKRRCTHTSVFQVGNQTSIADQPETRAKSSEPTGQVSDVSNTSPTQNSKSRNQPVSSVGPCDIPHSQDQSNTISKICSETAPKPTTKKEEELRQRLPEDKPVMVNTASSVSTQMTAISECSVLKSQNNIEEHLQRRPIIPLVPLVASPIPHNAAMYTAGQMCISSPNAGQQYRMQSPNHHVTSPIFSPPSSIRYQNMQPQLRTYAGWDPSRHHFHQQQPQHAPIYRQEVQQSFGNVGLPMYRQPPLIQTQTNLENGIHSMNGDLRSQHAQMPHPEFVTTGAHQTKFVVQQPSLNSNLLSKIDTPGLKQDKGIDIDNNNEFLRQIRSRNALIGNSLFIQHNSMTKPPCPSMLKPAFTIPSTSTNNGGSAYQHIGGGPFYSYPNALPTIPPPPVWSNLPPNDWPPNFQTAVTGPPPHHHLPYISGSNVENPTIYMNYPCEQRPAFYNRTPLFCQAPGDNVTAPQLIRASDPNLIQHRVVALTEQKPDKKIQVKRAQRRCLVQVKTTN